jgi:hypothetical protein
MINTDELRRNNWLYDHDGRHRQVYSISHDYVSLDLGNMSTQIYQRNPIISPDIDLLKPIPLDEEILLKCGFEKVPHFTVMNSMYINLIRDKKLSVGCVGTPNEMLFLHEVNTDDRRKTEDLIGIHNFDYDGKLYLHTLQNYYYFLSGGQELEIEL